MPLDDSSETLTRDVAPAVARHGRAQLLYVAFNAKEPLAPTSRHDLGGVDEVHLRRGAARETVRTEAGGKRTLVLTFPDPVMSGMHAYLRRRDDKWWVDDAGSKNGTWLDGERIEAMRVWNREVLEVGHTFLLLRSARNAGSASPDQSSPNVDALTALTTLSPELGEAFARLSDVAPSTIPVHVRGDSGTGKELVAREVHRISGRAGRFVAVNCGALPTGLVESELFGFRKGSFSGATEDRDGLVRAASSGTLFLDEIGDLPLASQAAFLRVLQERAVTPIGSPTPALVDFRLISATHRNLDALAASGRLRDDLLARITGFRVDLPRLSDRLEDLGVLMSRIAGDLAPSSPSMSFTPEAGRALFMHSWPQNVRELQRRIAIAVVLAKGRPISRAHLFESGEDVVSADAPSAPEPTASNTFDPIDVARRAELVALLREHGGNVTAVARAMGKARVQIQRWIRRYGIDRRAV